MNGVLIFGDSVSFGRGEFGSSPNLGWVGRLKQYFEAKDKYNCLFNLGIPGDTSTKLLDRIDVEIKARMNIRRPNNKFVILIAIGLNDSRGMNSIDNLQTNIDIFEQNMTQIANIAKSHKASVYLVGLTAVDESRTSPFEDTYFVNSRIREYDAVIKTLAHKNKIGFLDVNRVLSESSMFSDGVHPSTAGYQMLYELMVPVLDKEFLE